MSAPLSQRGSGGHVFNVYLWTNGNYVCIGDVGGHLSSLHVEHIDECTRVIWTYSHGSCQSGAIGTFMPRRQRFRSVSRKARQKMGRSAGDHLTRTTIERTAMTTYATVCSEDVPLRFSCRMTDFTRYAKGILAFHAVWCHSVWEQ